MNKPLLDPVQAEHARAFALRYNAWCNAIEQEVKGFDEWGSVLAWSNLMIESQRLLGIEIVPASVLTRWVERATSHRNADVNRWMAEKADPGGYGPSNLIPVSELDPVERYKAAAQPVNPRV